MTEHNLPESALLARFTIGEFERMIEAGVLAEHRRVELHEGVLVEMNAEYLPHARAKFELAVALRRGLESVSRPDLEVLTDVSIALSGNASTTPDISVWSRDESAKLLPATRALLVVEVAATTLQHDLGYKLRRYAGSGIGEYWVVDLDAGVVHQYDGPRDGVYQRRTIIENGSQLASATITGLAVALNF